MTETNFTMLVTDAYYGFTDIALMKNKVGKYNVTVYYSATDNGDELAPVKKPTYLIRITTLGRYPVVVKSERMPTFKDALRWLIEEFRRKYERE